MTFEKALGILRSTMNKCVDVCENWCESHHDNCKKCREEALENLKSAHDEEINHARKVEYHRGYNDGRKSVNPDEWQLEQHRRYVADRLRKYRDAPPVQTLETGDGDAIEIDAYTFGGILSAVMYPVTEFPTSMLIDRLIYLLVGEAPENAHPSIYKDERKSKTGTESNASTLQKSPDLTSCHELGKLLKKTLGEAKCIHDRLKDQSKSHADLKDENQRFKGECRMYRTMLNDATWEFTDLAAKHEAAQSLNRDMMDGLKDYMELPKGEDGEHIHVGDVMYDTEHTDEHAPVVCMLLNSDGWAVSDCNAFGRWKSPQSLRHHSKPDPIEETFRKYELGNLTSSEAIERIREATNVG